MTDEVLRLFGEIIVSAHDRFVRPDDVGDSALSEGNDGPIAEPDGFSDFSAWEFQPFDVSGGLAVPPDSGGSGGSDSLPPLPEPVVTPPLPSDYTEPPDTPPLPMFEKPSEGQPLGRIMEPAPPVVDPVPRMDQMEVTPRFDQHREVIEYKDDHVQQEQIDIIDRREDLTAPLRKSTNEYRDYSGYYREHVTDTFQMLTEDMIRGMDQLGAIQSGYMRERY